MKSLVIYDSLHGNTEKIASVIKEVLASKGDVVVKKVTDASAEDLTGVDLLVLGSPTHGGRMSQNTNNWVSALDGNAFKGMRAAAFDTSVPAEGQKFFIKLLIKTIGVAAPKMANTLKKMGADVVASETFWVIDTKGPIKEGELDRVKEWAGHL